MQDGTNTGWASGKAKTLTAVSAGARKAANKQ